MNKEKTFIENPSNLQLLDIELTPNDIKLLQKFNVKYQTSYTHMGYTKKMAGFRKTISEVGQNKRGLIVDLYALIRRIIIKVTEVYQEKYIWVEFKTSTKNTHYDWHTDRNYIPVKISKTDPEPSQTKFVITLKGNGLLYLTPTPEERKNYFANTRQAEDNQNPEEKPKSKNQIIKSLGLKVQQLESQQGALITGGNRDNALIYSEPVDDQPRITLSIVVAKQEEIEKRKARQQKYVMV